MSSTSQEIGILQRRRIEAEMIKPLYEILKRELGLESAQRIVAEAVNASAIQAGREIAAKEANGSNIKTFIAIQHLWTKDDALEYEVVSQGEDHYDYNVTQCRYAQMYKEMGLEEIGFLLSCNRDGKFIEGYAPQVMLERPHTLMQGHSHCDFRYRVATDDRDDVVEK